MLKTSTAIACNYCATIHPHINPTNGDPMLCHVCSVCFANCEKTEFCRWPDKNNISEKVMEQPTRQGDVTAISNNVSKSLEEAFLSWFVSSTMILGDTNEGNAASAWQEFQSFVQEILTPVDTKKRYLKMEIESGKVKGFDFVSADNLFTTQTGEYVQVNGKRRNRLGKDIAIM